MRTLTLLLFTVTSTFLGCGHSSKAPQVISEEHKVQAKQDDSATPDKFNAEATPDKLDAAPVDHYADWMARNLLSDFVATKVGDSELIFGYKNSTVYVPKNLDLLNTPRDVLGFSVGFRQCDGPFENHISGYVKIDGKPEAIQFQSSNPDVIEMFDDGSAGIKSHGKTMCRAVVRGETLEIEVKVKTLPFRISSRLEDSSTPKDVIETLGLPDSNTKHRVSWPDSEYVDGIYYAPSVGQSISFEHWKFESLPGAVIVIAGNSVYSIGSTYAGESREPIVEADSIRPELDEGRNELSPLDEKAKTELAGDEKEKGSKADAVVAKIRELRDEEIVLAEEKKERDQRQAKAEAEKRDAEFRTWKTADGKSNVEARMDSYRSGIVSLEKRDGTIAAIDVDKLSDEDKAYVGQVRKTGKR